MTGKDPLDCPEFRFDRRAFRDDSGEERKANPSPARRGREGVREDRGKKVGLKLGEDLEG